MKKFLNKLSNSGRYEEGALKDDHYSDDEEYQETHYRKSSTLPTDAPRDNPEDFKVKKSFNKKVLSPRSRDAMDTEEDFSKKKSASTGGGSLRLKEKDKLNESDDKVFRKSFSLRSMSLFKSSDQLKNQDNMKSPTLKGAYVSQYEQHEAQGGQIDSGDESSEGEDASVPHQTGTYKDDDFYTTTPIRVPSAPAGMASPYATRAINSPRKSPVPHSPPSLHIATPSPPNSRMASSPNSSRVASSPNSSRMAYSPPASPPSYTSNVGAPPSPSARVPTNPVVSSPKPVTANPHTSPHVIAADEFDARFGRMRTDSITDDYGADMRMRSDSVASEEPLDMEDDLFSGQKGKTGIFSFGSNKPKKLK